MVANHYRIFILRLHYFHCTHFTNRFTALLIEHFVVCLMRHSFGVSHNYKCLGNATFWFYPKGATKGSSSQKFSMLTVDSYQPTMRIKVALTMLTLPVLVNFMKLSLFRTGVQFCSLITVW